MPVAAALRGCLASGLLLAACAAGATVPPKAMPAGPTASPSNGGDGALLEFERLGRDLYRADRAAWLTTDQLHAQGLIKPKDVKGDLDGWVTSPTIDPNIWRVAYVTLVDDVPLAFADGTVDFSKPEPLASLRRNEPYRPLEPDELAQRAIRRDAIGRGWMACGRSPYNTATVPDGKGGWNVYLMPPQTSLHVFPMGGFHRFSYDEGGRFVEAYSHTRTCIEHSTADLPEGTTMESIATTHITGPTPNEFHAFMSLSYGKPIYVATPDSRFWVVVEGDIEYLSTLGKEP